MPRISSVVLTLVTVPVLVAGGLVGSHPAASAGRTAQLPGSAGVRAWSHAARLALARFPAIARAEHGEAALLATRIRGLPKPPTPAELSVLLGYTQVLLDQADYQLGPVSQADLTAAREIMTDPGARAAVHQALGSPESRRLISAMTSAVASMQAGAPVRSRVTSVPWTGQASPLLLAASATPARAVLVGFPNLSGIAATLRSDVARAASDVRALRDAGSPTSAPASQSLLTGVAAVVAGGQHAVGALHQDLANAARAITLSPVGQGLSAAAPAWVQAAPTVSALAGAVADTCAIGALITLAVASTGVGGVVPVALMVCSASAMAVKTVADLTRTDLSGTQRAFYLAADTVALAGGTAGTYLGAAATTTLLGATTVSAITSAGLVDDASTITMNMPAFSADVTNLVIVESHVASGILGGFGDLEPYLVQMNAEGSAAQSSMDHALRSNRPSLGSLGPQLEQLFGAGITSSGIAELLSSAFGSPDLAHDEAVVNAAYGSCTAFSQTGCPMSGVVTSAGSHGLFIAIAVTVTGDGYQALVFFFNTTAVGQAGSSKYRPLGPVLVPPDAKYANVTAAGPQNIRVAWDTWTSHFAGFCCPNGPLMPWTYHWNGRAVQASGSPLPPGDSYQPPL